VVYRRGDPPRVPAASGTVQLDADGTGRWHEAPPGRYRVAASRGPLTIEAEVEVPGPEVVLRYPSAGVVVLQPEGAEPTAPTLALAEATWELLSAADPTVVSPAVVRTRGIRAQLAPGTWRVELLAEDGRAWRGEVEVIDGEVVIGVLRLDNPDREPQR
jgi:hypothetical protein